MVSVSMAFCFGGAYRLEMSRRGRLVHPREGAALRAVLVQPAHHLEKNRKEKKREEETKQENSQ